MRMRARGKLHYTKYRPGDLYLSDSLYEDEMNTLLESSTVVAMTDKQIEDAMVHAVTQYKQQVESYQDRLTSTIGSIIAKFF